MAPQRSQGDAVGARQPRALDPWVHRSITLRCRTCMWFLEKQRTAPTPEDHSGLGRCRRHAPTMSGFPAVFPSDWCGDHKLDENRV
jgi:hypothetical protein